MLNNRLWIDKDAESTHTNERAPVLLQANEIFKSFGGQAVLKGVSLELRKGDVALLRGSNGSGKTTLLNILTGNLEPDSGTIQFNTGNVSQIFDFPRRWYQRLNPLPQFSPERIARSGMGRMWQDIRLFPTQNLQNNIAVARPHQLGENPVWLFLRPKAVAVEERSNIELVDAALTDLELLDRAKSYADQVSLGQCKRTANARALHAGARVLCCDEPMSGLDAKGRTSIISSIRKLVAEKQITVVIVEHFLNIPEVLDVATTVWTLGDGVVRVQEPDAVRKELTAIAPTWMSRRVNGVFEQHDSESGGEFLTRGATLLKLRGKNAVMMDGPPALEVNNLVVCRGRRVVIGDSSQSGKTIGLSFSLCRGEIGLLEAPNGWGKTTLLEAIAGTIPVRSGEIKLNGVPVKEMEPWKRVGLGLSLVRSRDNMFPSLTVREFFALSGLKDPPENLSRLSSRRMSDLSGGEKQRAAQACGRVAAKLALMLDEPFSSLDSEGLENIWKEIENSSQIALLIALPKVSKGDYI